jgi:hypothetical protein
MMRVGDGIARLKVTLPTDVSNSGATWRLPPIEPKSAGSGSSSTLNQVNDEDDDGNYEQ